MEIKELWKRIFGFDIGDRVRILKGKFKGREGEITTVLISPTKEEFFLVRIDSTTKVLCKKEDLDYVIEENGSSPIRRLPSSMRDSLCGSPK